MSLLRSTSTIAAAATLVLVASVFAADRTQYIFCRDAALPGTCDYDCRDTLRTGTLGE